MIIKYSSDSGTRDPFITCVNGKYYHCFSHGDELYISKSDTVKGLADAKGKKVYTPVMGTLYSSELWAPELHIVDGKCCIYVACDDGDNYNHRMYVLCNDSDDPENEYRLVGKITDDTDKWAIDGTILHLDGKMYMIWSGWEGDVNECQNLYIAEMSDAFTIIGKRHLISTPEFEWEKRGSSKDLPLINEGPCVLQKDGKTFLLYSASGSWCEDYCLGILEFTGGDVLSRDSWKKHTAPVFAKNENAKGPGHCSTVIENGKYYLVYHAFDKDWKGGWGGAHAAAQEFTWENGYPIFGEPKDSAC